MNTIHAHYQPPQEYGKPGGITFWAETLDAPQPIPQHGRTAKNSKPKAHPFTVCPNLAGEKRTLTLRLPAVKGIPLSSPELIHNWEIDTAEPTLAPFTVDGIWVSPVEALPVLLAYSTPQTGPGASYRPGTSFRYWNMVAALALEALATHKLIPVIDGEDARWLPVLDSPRDAQRLSQLEAAMPPICRAELIESDKHLSPRVLLNSFLNIFCDALTREWGRVSAPQFYRSDEPAHRWLEALFSDDPAIQLSPNQLQNLVSSHKAWMRNLHVAGDAAFRVAFRLEAPAIQEQPWQLHYLIQAKDDPSLLIPAGEVWKKTRGALTHLGHRFEQPQEKLLAGLGYAARLFPPITDSLKSRRPTELDVDTNGAYTFLRRPNSWTRDA